MASRSLCIIVLSLIACSLIAPADALWFGSHRFMSAASRGVVKPLRSPVLAFQHINSKDYAHTTATSWDREDFVFPTTPLMHAFCVTALSYLYLMTFVDGFGIEFGPGPFLFTNAAMRGDVWTLRSMVYFGQSVNAKAWKGRTALMRATSAGRPAAIRFLLEQGAETYTWGAEGSELDIAKRLLAEHTTERSLKDFSWQQALKDFCWQQENPPHLDSKSKRLSECVDLLQDPAKPARDQKAKRATRELLKKPSTAKDSVWPSTPTMWLCFPW